MEKLSEKDKTLHSQFSRYGRNAREWMRKCVLLLPKIERNRVWEKKGFGSIYEYAAKLAGMSRDTVNDSLRVLKKIENKPLLMEVAEQKGVNCIKPIVNLVDENNEKFWAEKAKMMSKNTLQVYVKAFREDNGRAGPSETLNFPQKKAITILIDAEVADQLEKLKGQNDWNELMKEILELRNKEIIRLKKEAEQKFKEIEKKKKQLSVETKVITKPKSTRPISTKIEKYVIYKTNNTCAFPGCTKLAENLHHVERFAITGRHNPEKIIPLCKEHHELAHNGLIENEEEDVVKWGIRREPDQSTPKFFIDQQVAAYRLL